MSAARADPHRLDTGWIRSKGPARFMRVLAWTEIALLIFFVTGSLVYPGNPWAERVAFSLGYFLLSAPLVTLSFRMARAGCRIESDALRIRNPIKEYEVSWGEMDRFSFGSNLNGSRLARVHLRDGRIIKIAGISSSALAPRKSASYNLVVGLQAELDRRRHSSEVD
jgi:hypothetical protein